MNVDEFVRSRVLPEYRDIVGLIRQYMREIALREIALREIALREIALREIALREIALREIAPDAQELGRFS